MGSILDSIHTPEDLRRLNDVELNALAAEIRKRIIDTISSNGGHLASNLGVVELTLALNLAFHPPEDQIVWDVGHQTYPQKLITGRQQAFSTIRQEDGLSGFPNRAESVYDQFTTGHSSTSISAALGLAEANRQKGNKDFVVAVIGDGALSGGLAYEGFNNAGRIKRNFIVVLNDNTMSISKNVGSVARHLSYIRTKPGYIRTKLNVESALRRIPVIGNSVAKGLKQVKRAVKKLFYKSTMFENFGFSYYGPFDGHDIEGLRKTFERAKLINKPVLIHVLTDKGKGYQYAEQAPSTYHGLSGFNIETGETSKSKQDFSSVFGDALCALAAHDERICAITAAMKDGTGLVRYKRMFGSRFYDVGIAEEHAVTFASGLAANGMLPVFAVYATFLQRAYDELLHDVAIQNLKVILAIDRAGIVGEDGVTHQGIYDAAFMQTIPSTVMYAPAYFCELETQLKLLVEQETGLCAIRYPRGMELKKPANYIHSDNAYDCYKTPNARIAIVTYGRLFSFAAEAREELERDGIALDVIKLNRIIPLEHTLISALSAYAAVLFFEEGVRSGGIGMTVSGRLCEAEYHGRFKLFAIDDPFVAHAPMYRVLDKLGLNAQAMSREARLVYKELEREQNM